MLRTFLLGAVVAASAVASPPTRVVSVNQCTDQLAILVAADDQLYSVSYLTLDPDNAVLAREASRYVVNHGSSEEIFLMKPDLVIAGTFSNRSAVALLRRLGFRVEEFDPVDSVDDIRLSVRRMGELLGRQDRAAELIGAFDRELERLTAAPEAGATARAIERPRIAFLFPNGYTFANGTLLDELATLAGFDNVTSDRSLRGLARLPLESLVLAAPDLLVSGRLGGTAPALANEIMTHPVLESLLEDARHLVLEDRYWVCGGPYTLETLRVLRRAHAALTIQAGADAP